MKYAPEMTPGVFFESPIRIAGRASHARLGRGSGLPLQLNRWLIGWIQIFQPFAILF